MQAACVNQISYSRTVAFSPLHIHSSNSPTWSLILASRAASVRQLGENSWNSLNEVIADRRTSDHLAQAVRQAVRRHQRQAARSQLQHQQPTANSQDRWPHVASACELYRTKRARYSLPFVGTAPPKSGYASSSRPSIHPVTLAVDGTMLRLSDPRIWASNKWR